MKPGNDRKYQPVLLVEHEPALGVAVPVPVPC